MRKEALKNNFKNLSNTLIKSVRVSFIRLSMLGIMFNMFIKLIPVSARP